MSDPTNTKIKVLLIDDEQDFRDDFRFAFERELFIRSVPDMEFAHRFLEKDSPDLILLDLALEKDDYQNGLERIKQIKLTYPSIPIIVITNERHPSTVITALDNGAASYLYKGDVSDKPDYREDWLKKIKENAQTALLTKENAYLKTEKETLEKVNKKLHTQVNELQRTPFIGNSPKINAIRKELEFIANENKVSVLITGETGVGKEVVARFLHENGNRADKPFVAVNLTEISPSLLPSELFGYRKGAFTGAKENKTGLFEHANHGILFLDEIGEIDLEFQRQLLRFLEDHIIRPVGSTETIQLDVQIVAATNKDLPTAVANKNFRSDLYQRLRVYPIELPPLRERKEDIPLLIAHFLNRPITDIIDLFQPTAYQKVLAYHWPGNVRELRNALEFMHLRQRMHNKKQIDESCLRTEILEYKGVLNTTIPKSNHDNTSLSHAEKLALVDLESVENALSETYCKKGLAAKKLNTNTDNLRYKVTKYYNEYPHLFERLPNIVKTYKLHQ